MDHALTGPTTMTLSQKRIVFALCLILSGASALSASAREPTYLESLGTDLRAMFWDPDRLEFRPNEVMPVSQVEPMQPFDTTPAAPLGAVEPMQPLDTGLSGSVQYRSE